MKTVTDEQLIQCVANGDPSCLATLFERHHRGVFRYLYRILGQRASSEDLVQDVFLKVLRKASHFRGEGSFKAWMFNIARNMALDHLRSARRQDTDTLDDEQVGRALTNDLSAEQVAAGRQDVGVLMRALARLPAAAQEVIWLGRFELDSYEELGRALDCSAGTARVRMHRAMALLKSTYTSMSGVPVDG